MLLTSKFGLAGSLLALGSLFTWSSWQAPDLSSYVRPTRFVVLEAPQLQPGPDSSRLQAQVAALPGVTACAIRPAKQLLVVAYNPDSLSQEQLCACLGCTAQTPPPPPPPSARQCPVPAGYVLALEKLRFALNLRRLFVQL